MLLLAGGLTALSGIRQLSVRTQIPLLNSLSKSPRRGVRAARHSLA